MTVLIITLPGDSHAHAVRWAIEKLGGSTKIVYPADLCDGASWAFEPSEPRLAIRYGSSREDLDFGAFRSIWMRRPPGVLPQAHLPDRVESAIAEGDFGTMAQSVYRLLERGRFAVNPYASTRIAGLKPLQLSVATEVGMAVPRTLVGNDPEAIRDFFGRLRGNVVFKPFTSPVWQTKGGPTMVPTTRLWPELLHGTDLAAGPGIFQELIDKAAEVRVTVMGRSVFAWEKRFDATAGLDVDWSLISRGARHSVHQLPTPVAERCFEMMDRLDLVFACFDFALDRQGRHVFLEVNPQGQWLWGDTLCGELNQLEAMAEFLLSGDPRFRYSGRDRFRLADYRSEVHRARGGLGDEWHFGHFMTYMHYTSSFSMDTALKRDRSTGSPEQLPPAPAT